MNNIRNETVGPTLLTVIITINKAMYHDDQKEIVLFKTTYKMQIKKPMKFCGF